MTTVLIVEVITAGRYMMNEVEHKIAYVNRRKAIQLIRNEIFSKPVSELEKGYLDGLDMAITILSNMPISCTLKDKYEYHYDHTDCIWYRPEARNRCPSTCAQYRDGWNDAMNYIFHDGEGYRPFRRDKKYEG